MKRYLSIFLLFCVLTGCVSSKGSPIPRQSYNPQWSVPERVVHRVFDGTVGKTRFYKKRVMKKAMVPLYDEILTGQAPYLVEDLDSSVMERRVTSMTVDPNIRFTFYDDSRFNFPLLIMSNRIEENYIFCIVQFFSDGSYATFNTLEPYAQSIFSTGLYTDADGRLYIDDAFDGTIYELNVVDGVLKINYGYSADGKGFATFHDVDFSGGEGTAYPSELYPNGSDVFSKIQIAEETKEPFDAQDMENLRNSLKPLEVLDFNEENFEQIASSYLNDMPEKKSKPDSGKDEKAIRQFAADNFSIYTTESGKECLWIHDYDNNGKLAAYAIVKKGDGLKLIYIDEDLKPRELRDADENTFIYEPKLLEAGKDAYLYMNQTGAAGGTGYLYGVKNNEVYEPDISSHIDLFDRVGDHFVNNETYLETSETGGVRKERETIYDYDQKSRQFVKAEKGKEVTDKGGSVNVRINGKDVGKMDVIRKGGVNYYPVGEMNKVCAENFNQDDLTEYQIQFFFEGREKYAFKDAEYNAWYFYAWPGIGEEFHMAYYVDKNLVISLDSDLETGTTYDYTIPKHKPIEKGGDLYMDLDLLAAIFGFEGKEEKGSISIKESYDFHPEIWKKVKGSPEDEVDELVKKKF